MGSAPSLGGSHPCLYPQDAWRRGWIGIPAYYPFGDSEYCRCDICDRSRLGHSEDYRDHRRKIAATREKEYLQRDREASAHKQLRTRPGLEWNQVAYSAFLSNTNTGACLPPWTRFAKNFPACACPRNRSSNASRLNWGYPVNRKSMIPKIGPPGSLDVHLGEFLTDLFHCDFNCCPPVRF